MNRNINIIIIVGLGLMLGLYFMADILSARAGNGVANMTKGMTVGMLILGAVRPQVAPYVIVLLSTFQNMIKRAAIHSGAFSSEDMIYTNAPPSALLLGAVAGMVFYRATRNRLFEKEFIIPCVLASGLVLLLWLRTLGSGVPFGSTLNVAVNGGAYMFLIPLIITFYPDIKSCKKLLKWVALCFIPVALYALSQALFGLNGLDAYYFQSGYTVMFRDENSGWMGMPGTLHNGVALSAAMLVVLYVLKAYHEGNNGEMSRKRSLLMTAWVFALILFVTALIIGSGRTQWVGLLLGLASIPFLTRKWASSSAYVGVIVVYVLMIFSAETLINKLEKGKFVIYKGDNVTLQKAFMTSTLSDRLIGLYNMRTNANLWTPFGKTEARALGEFHEEDAIDKSYTDTLLVRSDDYVHDMISQMIITFGYIPFVIMFAMGLWALIRTTGMLKRAQQFSYGRMLIWLMAGVIATLITGASSDKTLIQFPSNMLFWLIVAIVIVGVLQAGRDERIAVADELNDIDAQDENVA